MANGSEALDALRAAIQNAVPFQLALLDFNMIGMDGGELAEKIKADKVISDTPLILVTSFPQRGDAARMLEAGFDAYLTKPVKQSHLQQAMSAVMGLQRNEEPVEKKILITKHTLDEAERGRYKILVVEDNLINQKFAVKLLEKEGYRCDVATNGVEAVEALSRAPYDLVLMDCQMPEMDGFKATEEIRKREGDTRHTPIVAMTANVMQGDRQRCLKAGMDDYISKPVSAASIYEILEKYLSKAITAETVE